MHGNPSPVLSQCMGINPLLIFYKNSPYCHSARESFPCIVILHDSQFLFFYQCTVHGNQSPALSLAWESIPFSFSIKTPHTVTVHGNPSPALSQCMGIHPLHCHSAWESIPCIVTVHGNPSPALSQCMGINPPSHFV